MHAVISKAELQQRLIRREQFVADTEAFIDCRLPGSMPKENYSMIGPGVTQSDKQVINLREPHGFNIGAAGVHPGITNNLHLHFTAEVFIAASGRYTLRWGARGDEGELPLDTGDIVCMPTWIFRGFSSASDEYGFLMTVLGGDDTGGIIWSPDVLARARDTGLWLTKDNLLIDTRSTATTPSDDVLLPLMPSKEISALKRWSVAEMRTRVLAKSERDLQLATIDTAAGYRWWIAPVIGRGISQFRSHQPRVSEPQGFSVEWLRTERGASSASFFTAEKMVLINQFGELRVRLNEGEQALDVVLKPTEILSIPANVLRAFSAETDTAEAVMVLAGDGPKRPIFSDAVIQNAAANDVSLDASGFMAKRSLLPPAMLRKQGASIQPIPADALVAT